MSSLQGLLFCACLAACAAPSPTVETTSATVATFDRYRTFAFGEPEQPPEGFELSPRTEAVQNRMKAMVASALSRKGYVVAQENPDLLVMVVAGEASSSRERKRSRTAAAVMGEREETIVVPAGAIVVDVFDTAKGERVWQGIATGEIKESGIDENRLATTVDRIMTKFPARQ